MNPTNCQNYTLDRIKVTHYYKNLPDYLKKHKLEKEELCDEIRGRYSETKFSGNMEIRRLIAQLRNKNFYPPEKLKETNVFYLSHLKDNEISNLVTRVAQIALNGDQYIVLQNGQIINSDTILSSGLLTDIERRRARKKVIASPVRVFAVGGYPANNDFFKVPRPFDVICITVAGAQFENDRLEYHDFIVDKTSGNTPSLFPHYYPHSGGKLANLKTAWHDASKYPPILSGYHFDLQAFTNSLKEDIYLILKAFHHYIPNDKLGYFHATALGTGFFANFLMRKNIGQLVMHTLLEAYRWVLTNHAEEFPRLKVIVFPDWSLTADYTPKWQVAGFTVKGARVDVLDFRGVDKQKYVCGLINAGDCFTLPGNEFKYTSVEAMIGNNTDLRIRQNYNWNPYMLRKRNWVKIMAPKLN